MALNIPQVTPNQALDAIKALYPMRLTAQMVAMLHGSPGVGKSSIVRRAAKELGIELIDRRIGQMPPEDLIGLPDRDIASGVSSYLPPEWLPREGSGILFLDEFLCADSRVQNAALELLLDRRLGTYVLPDGWMVILAGNDASQGTATFSMTSAAADRTTHFHIVANASAWLDWAMQNNIHPAVMTIIKVAPHLLDGIDERVTQDNIAGTSPRGWEKVSHILHNMPDTPLREIVIAGQIGQAAATDFKQILVEIAAYAPVKEIMETEDSAKRVKMLPRSLNGLWAMAFGLQSEAIDLETSRRAIAVSLDIPKIELADEDGVLPLAEIQRLAHELLMAKIPHLRISREIIRTPEYKAAQAWWNAIKEAHTVAYSTEATPNTGTGAAKGDAEESLEAA